MEALAELSDRQVAILMHCEKGEENALVQVRSKVMREVVSAKSEFCGSTETFEVFVPHPTYPVNIHSTVSLVKVAHSVAHCQNAVLTNDSAHTPVKMHALLHFEAYSFFPQECLYDLFKSTHSVSPQFIGCAATRLASVDDFCTTVADFCTILRVPIHRIESSSSCSKYQKKRGRCSVCGRRCVRRPTSA